MTRINKGIINTGVIGGDASVRSEIRHVGDDIHIKADRSVVNIKGRAERIRMELAEAASLPKEDKGTVDDLIAELAAKLQTVAAQRPEEAGRILDSLELLTKELKRDRPDKSFVGTAWNSIQHAVEVASEIAPGIVDLAARLGAVLARLVL